MPHLQLRDVAQCLHGASRSRAAADGISMRGHVLRLIQADLDRPLRPARLIVGAMIVRGRSGRRP